MNSTRFILRACLKIPWESCFRGKDWMARRDKRDCEARPRTTHFGASDWQGLGSPYPQWSPTEEQRSQPARSPKTLRAAGLLSAAGVGAAVTARCGDAPASPPWPQPKSLAAGPHAIFRQALRTLAGAALVAAISNAPAADQSPTNTATGEVLLTGSLGRLVQGAHQRCAIRIATTRRHGFERPDSPTPRVAPKFRKPSSVAWMKIGRDTTPLNSSRPSSRNSSPILRRRMSSATLPSAPDPLIPSTPLDAWCNRGNIGCPVTVCVTHWRRRPPS